MRYICKVVLSVFEQFGNLSLYIIIADSYHSRTNSFHHMFCTWSSHAQHMTAVSSHSLYFVPIVLVVNKVQNLANALDFILNIDFLIQFKK